MQYLCIFETINDMCSRVDLPFHKWVKGALGELNILYPLDEGKVIPKTHDLDFWS